MGRMPGASPLTPKPPCLSSEGHSRSHSGKVSGLGVEKGPSQRLRVLTVHLQEEGEFGKGSPLVSVSLS